MIRPKICVTLSGCTVDEVLADAARASAVGADFCEVRLDKLWVIEEKLESIESENEEESKNKSSGPIQLEYIPREFDSVNLVESLNAFKGGIDLPVIMTCRPKVQGGYFPGSEEQRIDVLRSAIESGVSWIDLEANMDAEKRSELITLANGNTSVVSSIHLEEEPNSSTEIKEEIESMNGTGDIIKICYKATGRNSGLRLFEAAWSLRESDLKTAIMGIGPGGDWTRIHAPLLCQDLVYTTMESGPHLSSQGRINASDLLMAWELLEYE
tara:strand:+ start:52464 stop:53270 length:807 start_codon:yes stop_codon:yes gene_type:complete